LLYEVVFDTFGNRGEVVCPTTDFDVVESMILERGHRLGNKNRKGNRDTFVVTRYLPPTLAIHFFFSARCNASHTDCFAVLYRV
jgi:hypothetical protein